MESRSLDACSIVVDTRHLDSPPAFRSQDQRKYAVLRLYPHLRFVSRVRDSPNPQAATTPIKPSPYRLADSAPFPERLRCRQGHPQPCAPGRFSWGWSPWESSLSQHFLPAEQLRWPPRPYRLLQGPTEHRQKPRSTNLSEPFSLLHLPSFSIINIDFHLRNTHPPWNDPCFR